MTFFKYISLSLFIFTWSYADSIVINEYSNSFTIDTVFPDVVLYEPEHGDVFSHGETIEFIWESFDSSPGLSPITIYATPYLNSAYVEIAQNISDEGMHSLDAPDFINSMFVSVRLDYTDYYGNVSSSYSNGYFTIGTPNEDQYVYETETFYGEFSSSGFTIDTNPPEITWVYPNDATTLLPLQPLVVRWESTDENLGSEAIDIFFDIDAGNYRYILEENIANSGIRFINMPDTTTQLGQFIVEAVDLYGNVSFDNSDGYMIVGQENSDDFQQTTSTDTSYSSSFILDTKLPVFSSISDNNDFYPNGGELLSDYSNISVEFAATDDSDDNAVVDVYLAYILGGWYVPIAENIPISSTSSYVDMSLNGIVEPTIWARLIFKATDDYGNSIEQYNNDYFILGTSEGNLGVNWFEEDELKVLVDWSWDGKSHSVGIKPAAYIEHLNAGDIITVVDLNGINSSSCDDSYGYTELAQFTINETSTLSPENILKSIDHCSQGGERRIGYVRGNPIYFKITHLSTEESYVVSPVSTNLTGSDIFNDSHSIIRELDYSSPISSDSLNFNNNITFQEERDFDSFSVFNKVGSIQLRDCDVPGTGENEGWCFEDVIYGQTSYISQVSTLQQSSNIKYRVWLLDGSGNEVFKTLDTEGINYYVDLTNIYDNALSAGWNWFSSNMLSSNMELNNVLNTVGDNASYIKSQSGYADYYDDYGWFGNFSELDNLSMFKIYLNNTANIVYEGTIVSADTPIPLSAGWNWISYLPDSSLLLNNALSSIGDNATYLKSQNGYADYYDEYGWFGNMTDLEPQKGYQIYSTIEASLVYPTSSLLARNNYNNHSIKSESFWDYDYKAYEHNGSVTIGVDSSIPVSLDDQIGAFYNNECIGVAYATFCPINDEIIFPMMIHNDRTDINVNFKYFSFEKQTTYDLNKSIIYYPDMFIYNALEPFMLGREMPLSFKLNNPYPNPFNPTSTIEYSLAENVNNLKINIYDIRGRLVENLYNNHQKFGYHKITWNASQYASGIYFIHMNTDNQNFVKKLMLVK